MRIPFSPPIHLLTLVMTSVWLVGFDRIAGARTTDRSPAASKVSFQRQPVTQIPPGTTFDAQPPLDWSQLISFVRGQLTRGDVDAVIDDRNVNQTYPPETLQALTTAIAQTLQAGKKE